MIGKTISHYKVIEKLGGGGMGVVYKAQDLKLDRFVALKFLPPHLTSSDEEKQRFIHEAKAASALQHSNICTIHDIDETDDGRMFICMDYYEGETLKKKIESGPHNINKAIDIAIQIARGLEAAHEANEIHRDIKPANIMITAKGEVKIVDFGLAKLAGQTRLTMEGTTLGTVGYMSPEQTRGDNVDQRTDIWSLGVVFYEMISGQRPFKGDYDQAVMYSIVNEPAEPLTALRTAVPMELERIVIKALSKKPEERYPNAADLIVDLKKVKNDFEKSEKPTLPKIIHQKPLRKKLYKFLIPSALLILIISAYIFLKPIIFEEFVMGEPQPVVVISFKNQTGDASYDYLQQAIPNLLITSLEQSKYLQVIPWERVYDLLKQMGKGDVDLIDEEIGYEICRMEGVEAIVLGSYVKAGEIFATDVKVLDVQSKQLLKSASAKGEGVGSILQSQIDDLSQQISEHLVFSETTVRGTALRISDITTASMEAYHYFIKGRDLYEKMYYDDARRALQQTIQIDSTFALAYLYLAWAHGQLSNEELRDECYEKAKMYAYKAGEKDRLYIDAHYAAQIEKNPQKRLAILEEMAKKYPKEKRVFYRLGLYYDNLKQYDKAIAAYEKALHLDPQFGPALNMMAYVHGDIGEFEKADEYLKRYAAVLPGDANPFDSIGELYIRIGRLNKAINKYKEALEVRPDFGSEWRIAYTYALQEDYKSALLWIDNFMENITQQGYRGRGYWWNALYHHLSRNHSQVFNNLDKSEEGAFRLKSEFGVVMTDLLRAWILLDQGEPVQSQKYYEKYYTYRSLNSPQYLANYKTDRAFYMGLNYLKRSLPDSARLALHEIKTIYPNLTPLGKERHDYKKQYLYMRILLEEDSLTQAENIYRTLKPLDTPFGFTWNYMVYNFPFSQDNLAQAYVKHGKTDKAIELYKRLIEINPKKRGWRLINPIYHYRLAKLYEEVKNLGKAIQEYKKFIEICGGIGDDSDELSDARNRLIILEKNIVLN
jgi:serine/threonine protein kinase/tetratricopeptide (TPR) repeat protein